MTELQDLRNTIEAAWDNRELLKDEQTKKAVLSLIEFLDKGLVRVAEPKDNGEAWQVNEWVKKGVILYFPIQQIETEKLYWLSFMDKNNYMVKYQSLTQLPAGLIFSQ